LSTENLVRFGWSDEPGSALKKKKAQTKERFGICSFGTKECEKKECEKYELLGYEC
jgi:hypothetical protein